jgi:hypothetical protein
MTECFHDVKCIIVPRDHEGVYCSTCGLILCHRYQPKTPIEILDEWNRVSGILESVAKRLHCSVDDIEKKLAEIELRNQEIQAKLSE